MKGELEVFSSQKRSEEEVNRFIQSMGQEINFLIKLANNLLILARVDSGVANLSFTYNRLDEIVISQISRLSKLAMTKNISVQINFDSFYQATDAELTIFCDKELMGVLFYNLIENAIKYSPEHSRVEVVAFNNPDSLMVTVADEGEGVSPDALDKIFERFFRQPSMARIAQGSGLGLAICKVVADSVNAKIWAEKKDDSPGSRFCFEIPKNKT